MMHPEQQEIGGNQEHLLEGKLVDNNVQATSISTVATPVQSNSDIISQQFISMDEEDRGLNNHDLSVCLSDDDFNFDELIQKVDSQIEKENQNSKTMRLGSRHVEMKENDKIYYAGGPVKSQTKTEICGSCLKFVFKGESEMVFCQFCGFSNCKPCMFKERVYPRARLDDSGQKARGRICQICDRKFLAMILMLDEVAVQQKKRNEAKRLEARLAQLKQEQIDLLKQKDQERSEYYSQLNKLQRDIDIQDALNSKLSMSINEKSRETLMKKKTRDELKHDLHSLQCSKEIPHEHNTSDEDPVDLHSSLDTQYCEGSLTLRQSTLGQEKQVGIHNRKYDGNRGMCGSNGDGSCCFIF